MTARQRQTIDDLKNQLAACQAQIDKLQTTIVTMQSTIAEKDNAIGDLTAKVTDLTGQVAALMAEVKDLQAQLDQPEPPPAEPPPTGRFRTGILMTQSTFAGGDSAAISRAKTLMAGMGIVAQHYVRWGTVDPGQPPYDWGSLDKRVGWMRDTKLPMALVACSAPKYMTQGQAGGDIPPLPQFFDEYADYIAQGIKRYPDVEYLVVWNEMKGMWNHTANRWDYEQYVTLYNLIYDAARAQNPGIKIGGPYSHLGIYATTPVPGAGATSDFDAGAIKGEWGNLDMRGMDVICYFVDHAKGYDFLCYDFRLTDKDKYNFKTTGQAALDMLVQSNLHIRKHSNKPIWCTEQHLGPVPDADIKVMDSLFPQSLTAMKQNNPNGVVLWWAGQTTPTGDTDSPGIWTNCNSGGGYLTSAGKAVFDWMKLQ